MPITKVSIIVPAKKEEGTILECVTRILRVCPQAEILVVDSGLDQTRELIQKLNHPQVRYILSVPDRGKGDAIAQGIRESCGDVIVQIDSDLQFMPEDIPALLEPIFNQTADMVLGSRFHSHSKRKNQSSVRSFGNVIISLWASALIAQRVTDGMAGLKAWKKEVTQSFALTSYHFSYEIELFVKAIRKKWRVMEVPVATDARRFGESKLPIFKTGFRVLRDTLLFRFF